MALFVVLALWAVTLDHIITGSRGRCRGQTLGKRFPQVSEATHERPPCQPAVFARPTWNHGGCPFTAQTSDRKALLYGKSAPVAPANPVGFAVRHLLYALRPCLDIALASLGNLPNATLRHPQKPLFPQGVPRPWQVVLPNLPPAKRNSLSWSPALV